MVTSPARASRSCYRWVSTAAQPLLGAVNMDAAHLWNRVLLVAVLSLSSGCGQPSSEVKLLSADAGASEDPVPSEEPGACPAGIGGPQASYDPPRRTLPFTYVAPPADAASDNCAGNADALRCRGPVLVKRTTANLALLWPDGSRMVWSAIPGAMTVGPPSLADGDAAWVAYDHDEVCANACFGGRYERDQLEIRAGEAGRLLWIATQGQELEPLPDATVLELFGVKAHLRASCRHSFAAGCWSAERTVYDHILETAPPTVLHHAQLEHVMTAKGSYDVLWAESSEVPTYDRRCADGPTIAHDRGFAAVWIGP
jgi:hypothetical protein